MRFPIHYFLSNTISTVVPASRYIGTKSSSRSSALTPLYSSAVACRPPRNYSAGIPSSFILPNHLIRPHDINNIRINIESSAQCVRLFSPVPSFPLPGTFPAAPQPGPPYAPARTSMLTHRKHIVTAKKKQRILDPLCSPFPQHARRPPTVRQGFSNTFYQASACASNSFVAHIEKKGIQATVHRQYSPRPTMPRCRFLPF